MEHHIRKYNYILKDVGLQFDTYVQLLKIPFHNLIKLNPEDQCDSTPIFKQKNYDIDPQLIQKLQAITSNHQNMVNCIAYKHFDKDTPCGLLFQLEDGLQLAGNKMNILNDREKKRVVEAMNSIWEHLDRHNLHEEFDANRLYVDDQDHYKYKLDLEKSTLQLQQQASYESVYEWLKKVCGEKILNDVCSTSKHPIINAKSLLHSHVSEAETQTQDDQSQHLQQDHSTMDKSEEFKLSEHFSKALNPIPEKSMDNQASNKISQESQPPSKIDQSFTSYPYYLKPLVQYLSDPHFNHALGSIIGAFLGDSIGSHVEFTRNPPENRVLDAISMKGGGPFHLSPGQLTDDSELALSQLNGLIEGNGVLSLDRLAKYYRLWMISPPFDLGATIHQGLYPLLYVKNKFSCKGWANEAFLSASDGNQRSESNGGLMRITPLAIWCSKLDDKVELEEAIKKELSFTHPNLTSQLAGIAYCIAIRSLLKNEGDKGKALKEVEEWIKIQNNRDIQEWWKIVEDNRKISTTQNMGWAKIAWTYSFIFLKQKDELDFKHIMKTMIEPGGDTDTNACIVGGLIGAALGFKKLYEQCQDQVQKLLTCDCARMDSSQPRSIIYNPSQLIELLPKLLAIAPRELKIANSIDEEEKLFMVQSRQ